MSGRGPHHGQAISNISSSLLVCNGGCAVLVNQSTAGKSFHREWFIQWMRIAFREVIGIYPTRTWRGFESTSTPSAICIKSGQRKFADDWTRVRTNIYDASPLP